MKQIDIDAAEAFYNHADFKRGNTEVSEEFTGTRLYLHGNCIATLNGSELTLSSCGWETSTTRARLNGVLTPYGFTLSQKAGEWYIITPDMQKINFYDGIKINLDTKEVIK